MGPEAKVKNKVKRMLQKHGAYQFWPVQTGYGSPALDCYGSHCGLFFAIEAKAPGKHPTERQKLLIGAIANSGAPVFIIGERKDTSTGEYSGMVALEGWLLLTKEQS